MRKEIDIKAKLKLALEKLLKNEKILILLNINERTLTHKLAIYLQEYFKEWDVDCEYNRNHDVIKRLAIIPGASSIDDIHARTVFPDIIVHKRGTDKNILVVEMKKTTSSEPDEFDKNKLQAFKSQLKYRYAVFVKIQTNPVAIDKIDWIE